tara:strand:- start:59 stop:643 length:585 start_codon:yes stop_codon:yes gene_type:complete
MNTKDLIKTYNVLSKEECVDIISWFHEVEDRHVDGAVYGYDAGQRNHVIKDKKRTRQVYPTPDDSVSDILTKAFFEGMERYKKECPLPPNSLSFTGYTVRKYEQGEGFFGWHIDQGPGPGNISRVLGIVMYLNDVEEGGNTDFPNQDISIPCVAGDILIFPCNYLFPHVGTMPITDHKYAATAFISYLDNPQQS